MCGMDNAGREDFPALRPAFSFYNQPPNTFMAIAAAAARVSTPSFS
jgi:hypothetical protein